MLSIIIPTLNAAECLEPLLIQVSGEVEDIVVTDGLSEDATIAIALKYKARLALGHAGRGTQLARGAKWARGDWLLFLHADTILPDDWFTHVRHHIEKNPSKAGYFDFALDAKGFRPRIVEFLANIRSSLFALPYGDQGILISRKLYDQIGGFPDWPLFEDVALVKKLGRGRLKRLPIRVETGAERFEKHGYFKSILSNFILFTRYRLGADPWQLYRRYQK
jgi:rSAM/selenodomain-associated transferase 2